MKYNSEILRHEADHFDSLKEKFPDITVSYEDNYSYYETDLVLPVANDVVVSNSNTYTDSLTGIYLAHLNYKTSPCEYCNKFYKQDSDGFYVNSISTINVFQVVRDKLVMNDFELHAYDYASIWEQLKVPSALMKDVDLYLLKFIQSHSEVKKVRIPSRLHRLLPFV